MPSAAPRKTTTPGTGAAGPKSGKGKGKGKGKVAGRETSRRAQGVGKGNKKRKTKKLEAPKKPLTRKQWAWRISKWAALAALVGTAISACTIAVLFWYWGRDPDLPTVDKLTKYEPVQVVRVATRDGTVVGEIFTERRTFVPYEKIPERMIHAVLSAEDADFFQHQGIDYWGMVRALFVNVKSGKKKQGASTITQQVVKTFLLTPERTLKRKFQEIILARRLEKRLTKEQILTLYLNQIYFGGGRYGVQEAARYYFGKDLGELNIGEVALIAGLPQSPENLTPKKPKNREAAKNRQIYVLREMHKNGYISKEQADRFAREPIAIVDDPYPGIGSAPELVEVARQELIERHGEEAIGKLGGTVVTTVSDDVQAIATEALRKGLREVDERQKYGRPIKRLKEDKIKLELAKLARKLPKKGPKAGEVYRAVVLEVHDDDRELVVDLGDWKAAVLLGEAGDERYNPKGLKASERFARGDVIRVVRAPERKKDDDDARKPVHAERLAALEPAPEGAVVVIDPKSREVLALVGGYDSVIAGYNRATMAKRQAGSTFKPFVYAAAIDTGEYSPATIVNDAPEVYDLWKPQNYKKGEHEGPVRLRHALAKSINTVAIRVAHDVTPGRVAEVAHEMGIQSELPDGLSLALGSGEVTPLELTNAFATFAAGGRYAPPRFVREVAGQPAEPATTREAIRPEVAYVVAEMMRSVVEEGTGRRADKLNLGVVGKTGTSNDARDAWFVGMTPDLVVGVWVGFDDPKSLGRKEGGGRTAAPIFVELMSELRKKRPMRARKLERPPSIVEAKIDKATGKLAPEGAPPASVYTEVFIEGTVPTEVAPAPGEVDAESYVVEAYEDAYDAYDAYGDGEPEDEGGGSEPPGQSPNEAPGAGTP